MVLYETMKELWLKGFKEKINPGKNNKSTSRTKGMPENHKQQVPIKKQNIRWSKNPTIKHNINPHIWSQNVE